MDSKTVMLPTLSAEVVRLWLLQVNKDLGSRDDDRAISQLERINLEAKEIIAKLERKSGNRQELINRLCALRKKRNLMKATLLLMLTSHMNKLKEEQALSGEKDIWQNCLDKVIKDVGEVGKWSEYLSDYMDSTHKKILESFPDVVEYAKIITAHDGRPLSDLGAKDKIDLLRIGFDMVVRWVELPPGTSEFFKYYSESIKAIGEKLGKIEKALHDKYRDHWVTFEHDSFGELVDKKTLGNLINDRVGKLKGRLGEEQSLQIVHEAAKIRLLKAYNEAAKRLLISLTTGDTIGKDIDRWATEAHCLEIHFRELCETSLVETPSLYQGESLEDILDVAEKTYDQELADRIDEGRKAQNKWFEDEEKRIEEIEEVIAEKRGIDTWCADKPTRVIEDLKEKHKKRNQELGSKAREIISNCKEKQKAVKQAKKDYLAAREKYEAVVDEITTRYFKAREDFRNGNDIKIWEQEKKIEWAEIEVQRAEWRRSSKEQIQQRQEEVSKQKKQLEDMRNKYNREWERLIKAEKTELDEKKNFLLKAVEAKNQEFNEKSTLAKKVCGEASQKKQDAKDAQERQKLIELHLERAKAKECVESIVIWHIPSLLRTLEWVTKAERDIHSTLWSYEGLTKRDYANLDKANLKKKALLLYGKCIELEKSIWAFHHLESRRTERKKDVTTDTVYLFEPDQKVMSRLVQQGGMQNIQRELDDFCDAFDELKKGLGTLRLLQQQLTREFAQLREELAACAERFQSAESNLGHSEPQVFKGWENALRGQGKDLIERIKTIKSQERNQYLDSSIKDIEKAFSNIDETLNKYRSFFIGELTGGKEVIQLVEELIRPSQILTVQEPGFTYWIRSVFGEGITNKSLITTAKILLVMSVLVVSIFGGRELVQNYLKSHESIPSVSHFDVTTQPPVSEIVEESPTPAGEVASGGETIEACDLFTVWIPEYLSYQTYCSPDIGYVDIICEFSLGEDDDVGTFAIKYQIEQRITPTVNLHWSNKMAYVDYSAIESITIDGSVGDYMEYQGKSVSSGKLVKGFYAVVERNGVVFSFDVYSSPEGYDYLYDAWKNILVSIHFID